MKHHGRWWPVSAAHRADLALRNWHIGLGSPTLEDVEWQDYRDALMEMEDAVGGWPEISRFLYTHPVHLQDDEMGVGKPYTVRLAYSDMAGDGAPVIAIGGLTNVIQRFDFLAMDAAPDLRVIRLDLAGRGRSGWMAELSDYTLDTYVDQIRGLMDHLYLESATLLGSSLGGSAAIRFAARTPERVDRLILNDIGPFIPVERRARRARSVARHYAFHTPHEMFRRTGAAAKQNGPAPDAVLLHSAHNKTRWSEEESGRVYRHDLRALLAYRAEAQQSLDQWHDWAAVQCPVLVLHGETSDALTPDILDRMRLRGAISFIHVPETGHTPTLSDGPLVEQIVRWTLDDRPLESELTLSTAPWPHRFLYAEANV